MAEELRQSNERYQRYLTAFLKFMEKAKVREEGLGASLSLCGSREKEAPVAWVLGEWEGVLGRLLWS